MFTVGVVDDSVIDRSRGSGSVGIGCAFGWPIGFVEFLNAHAVGSLPERAEREIAWRSRRPSYVYVLHMQI